MPSGLDALAQFDPTADPLVGFLLLLVITVLPPILFAIYLRNAERHRREPWRGVIKAFVWGGTVAVFLAVVAQLVFAPLVDGFDPYFAANISLATILLAPVTEEIAKGLGLLFVRDNDPEPEDGYVYGGILGFGFAATENVLYVAAALLLQGQEIAMITAMYRGVVTVALHGAASAIAGAGIWRAKYEGGLVLAVAGLLLAILLHGVYNGLVSAAPPLAALLAAVGAVYTFWRIRKRVKMLDRANVMRLGF